MMAPSDAGAAIGAALDRLAGGLPALGIAFSGGGDSTALLHAAAEWAAPRGIRLAAATVDHRLRPESAAEAAAMGARAARLGIAHRVLVWPHPHPPGNTAAEARKARLRLLAGWVRDEGLAAVALGHTSDDVAETLLMRLGRGAGLDGLAAMAERREAEGVLWLRPMLALGRADLRGWLAARGLTWIDDPSNDDTRHERARIRKAMAGAGDKVTGLGLDSRRLAESAAHLRTAREALGVFALQATAAAECRFGMLEIPRPDWDAAPGELQRMILIAAARWITGAPYPPRAAATAAAMEALAAGRATQLAGALIRPGARVLRILREPAGALRAPPLTGDGIWDDRWTVTGLPAGHEVRALGPAPAGPHPPGLPGAAWRAGPALWQGGRMVAPLLPAPPPGLAVAPLRDGEDLRRLLASG